MKCKEIMTQNPIICCPDDDIITIINVMWDYDCGGIPVVDDMESKKLVGMITDRDIAMHVAKHACIHPSEAKVKDCMSSKVFSCKEMDDLEIVAKIMSDNQIRRIPIIDENESCVGIISQSDLLSFADDKELILETLKYISMPHKSDNEESDNQTNEDVTIEKNKKKKIKQKDRSAPSPL